MFPFAASALLPAAIARFLFRSPWLRMEYSVLALVFAKIQAISVREVFVSIDAIYAIYTFIYGTSVKYSFLYWYGNNMLEMARF